MPRRRRRHQPRFSVWTFVAPVALVAAVLVVVNVARPMLRTTAARTPSTALTGPTTPSSTAPAGAKKHRKRFYVVQRGDSLSAIAQRFGVAQARLLTLNPSIDPLALKPGQRLRVA